MENEIMWECEHKNLTSIQGVCSHCHTNEVKKAKQEGFDESIEKLESTIKVMEKGAIQLGGSLNKMLRRGIERSIWEIRILKNPNHKREYFDREFKKLKSGDEDGR